MKYKHTLSVKNNEALLTVIVTVYNFAAYIPRCIESILSQTYQNIEIILVDDGSVDGSALICDEYEHKDDRIVTIHKKNEGVVSARYQGIKSARGKVITFVDGDDWIEPDMYEHLMSIYQKEQPDMISSGLIWDWRDKVEFMFDGIAEGVYERKLIVNEIFPQLAHNKNNRRQGITASVCCKLFDVKLLNEIIKMIDLELTLGEDGAIVYCFLGRAEKMVILHQAWYHYEQHENSANRTFGITGFEKIRRLKECLNNGLKEIGVDNFLSEQADIYVKSFLFAAIKDYYNMDIDKDFYLFPFNAVPKGSKIILYGAGKVGRSYWKCLKNRKYAELVAWIDKDYENLQEKGFEVESLASAICKEYDYIVIAIDRKEIAEEIQNILISNHVSKNKIVWESDTMIF